MVPASKARPGRRSEPRHLWRPDWRRIHTDKVGRSCAFCGGRPLSKEHVIPRWTLELLGINRAATVTRHTVRDDVRRDGWDMAAPDIVVRRVCKSCNNGWMARLEAEAAPILRPMVASLNRTRIRRADVPLISTWMTKTALAVELVTEHAPPIVPTWQYRWLYEHRDCRHGFPDARAWVGAYRVTDHSPYSWSSARIGPIDLPEAGAWRTVINIGSFVFVLVVLPGAGDLLARARLPAEVRRFVAPFPGPGWWGRRWPPRGRIMREHDLHVVSGIRHQAWTSWRAGE